MSAESKGWWGWTSAARLFAQAAIVALGLGSLVGSGGGASLGFPPCTESWCNNSPLPLLPSAAVQPPALTAQVGSTAQFSAISRNFVGTVSYRWLRSADGGVTYTDIPGATTATLTLPGVNLLDDGLRLRVAATSSGSGTVFGNTRLLVSAMPAVVFADGEFSVADWVQSPVADPGQLPFPSATERFDVGGNTGAWLRMSYTVPAGSGSARLFYSRLSQQYVPTDQGAVYVIDYAEDCIVASPNELVQVGSALVIEQGMRRFLWNVPEMCMLPTWTAATGRNSLVPGDFSLVDGPACPAGKSCPDFSATAEPLRFGFRRIVFGSAGTTVVHGIDNWRVTVWRR